MAYVFPSDEWVVAYSDAINASSEYQAAAGEWDQGPVAMVCQARPDLGIEEDVGMWLDLHKGVCREAYVVDVEKARSAPYCISGPYDRWKQVIRGRLDPITAIMQGKFRMKGNLADLVRYVEASRCLVECACDVETEFPDE